MRPTTTYHRVVLVAQAMVLSVLVCLGLMAVPRVARADEPDITSNPEYVAALGELDRIASMYSAVAQEQSSTLIELEDVRGQIADNETKISGVEEKVATTASELVEMKKTLASHIASDYKTGGVSLLSIVLSSDSFEDAISRMYYHNVVCAHQMDEIDDVNAKKKELQSQKDELQTLRTDLEKREANLEDLYAQQSAQAEEMQAQQVEASAYLNSLSAELKAALAKEDEDLLGSAQAVAEEAEQADQEQGQAAADEGGEAKESEAAKTDDGNAGSGSNGSSNSGSTSKPTGNSGSSSNSSSSSNSNSNSNSSSSSTKPTNNTSTTTKPTTTNTPTSTGASGTQQAVLNACYSTGGSEPLSKGWGCAGWVYCVFRDSGVYNKKPRCAAWYYENWCFSSNKADLQPGMVIAVSTWTGTAAGKIYGHVGIYVGNNTVRHLSAGAVREMSLDKWIRQYGTTVTPMWGWNGGIVLT